MIVDVKGTEGQGEREQEEERELFNAVRPAGRSEYSYQEVADAIRGEGGPTISATYLWQLRKGIRDNPTRNHLAALARFFGVSPAYFFDDDAAEVVDAQLSLLAAMRDASVRSVALRAAGLSVESLAAVRVVIDHARRLEGLEADSGAAGPYPLWDGLYQAVPGIALHPVPAWADRLDPRDLRMRLYRRVIEIRDGYMALSPVDVPGIEETVRAAAGRRALSAADELTVTAATRLELARRAELRGEVRALTGVPHPEKEFSSGTDLDSEVRLLRVVAAHWTTIRLAAESIERGSRAGQASPSAPVPNKP